MNLTILYRGPLSSCNYGCEYCPFAKHVETREEHEHDAQCLSRFVLWATEQHSKLELSVFFTPWGEALTLPRYQEAIAKLTQLDHVRKVAIQTNMSCSLQWLEKCRLDRLGLWVTYHPSEVSRQNFLRQCALLLSAGVRFSVGIVGLKENLQELAAIRAELPADVYVWVNAYKRVPDYYSEAEVQFISSIDVHFPLNNTYHQSFGKACRTGASVISVDGEGNIRRCHFIKTVIGNLYDEQFERFLGEAPCTNQVCGCHIGYMHMDDLKLTEVYGDRLLERIPIKH